MTGDSPRRMLFHDNISPPALPNTFLRRSSKLDRGNVVRDYGALLASLIQKAIDRGRVLEDRPVLPLSRLLVARW